MWWLRTVHFLWPEYWQPLLGCFLLIPRNWRNRVCRVLWKWNHGEKSYVVLWDVSVELEGCSCPIMHFMFVTPGIVHPQDGWVCAFLEKPLCTGSPFSDDQNQIIRFSSFYMNVNFSCLMRCRSPSAHPDYLVMKPLLGMDYMLSCLISYTSC